VSSIIPAAKGTFASKVEEVRVYLILGIQTVNNRFHDARRDDGI
jgi:hypothetical protein